MADLVKKSMLSLADLYFITDDGKVRLQWSSDLYYEKNTKPDISDYDPEIFYGEFGEEYIFDYDSYYGDLAKYNYIKDHVRSTELNSSYYIVEIYNMETGETTYTEKIYDCSVDLELPAGGYICQVKAYDSNGKLLDSSGKNFVNTCFNEDDDAHDEPLFSGKDCAAEFELFEIGRYYGAVEDYYYARLAAVMEIRKSDGTATQFMVCGPQDCGGELWKLTEKIGCDFSISNSYSHFGGDFHLSGNILVTDCGLYEYENGQWNYKAYLQPELEPGECRSNAEYLYVDDGDSDLKKKIYYYDTESDKIVEKLTASKQVYGVSANYYMTENGIFSINTNKLVLTDSDLYGEYLLFDDLLLNVHAVKNGKKCNELESGEYGSIVAEYFLFDNDTKQAYSIGKNTMFSGRVPEGIEMEGDEIFEHRIGNCFVFGMQLSEDGGYKIVVHAKEGKKISVIEKTFDNYMMDNTDIKVKDGKLIVGYYKEVYDDYWGDSSWEYCEETIYDNVDMSSFYQPDISLKGAIEYDDNNWDDMKSLGSASSKVDRETVAKLTNEKIGEKFEETISAEDKVDYFEFTLQHAAKLSFTVNADNAATFAVYQLTQGKNGTYSLKSLQSSALKKDKSSGKYYIDTKELLLTADTYYIGITNTDKKVDYDSDYDFTLNGNSAFFDNGDKSDDWDDMKYKGAAGAVKTIDIYESVENWVGFGDAVDYFQITLDYAAKLSFSINASDSVKFTIYELKQNKNGTYALKSLQNTALKLDKYTNMYTADSKALLLQANTYYVAVQSTNANKGGYADYDFSINDSSRFFDQDPDYNNWDDMKYKGAAGAVKTIDIYESVENWVGFGDAVDYFQITLDYAAKLSFSINASDSVKFTIYELKQNKNGTYALKSLQNTALKLDKYTNMYTADSKALLLQANTYYIAVQSTNANKGGYADYSFSLNDSSRFFDQDPDYNNWEDMKYIGNWSDEYDVIDDIFYSTSGFVGYNDAIDYMQFEFDGSQKITFSVSATDAVQFSIYQLKENKNGTFSLKSLQSTALKKDAATGEYYINTKALNLAAGTYYIGVKSTNASKGGYADYTFTAKPVVTALNLSIGISEREYENNRDAGNYDSIYGTTADDTIKVSGKNAGVEYLSLDDGNDKLVIEKDSEAYFSEIEMGSGNDTITVNDSDLNFKPGWSFSNDGYWDTENTDYCFIDMGSGNDSLIFNDGDLESMYCDLEIRLGEGNDVMKFTNSGNFEHYAGNFILNFGEGNNTLQIDKDSFFSASDSRMLWEGESCSNNIYFGSGKDTVEIASGTEMRLCGDSGMIDFGEGVDTLILNGTLAINNAYFNGLEIVKGSGQLLLGGDNGYVEEDFQKFIDAGIDVINIGTACPFSSRKQELADNQFAKAASFERDDEMLKANIWVCSEEYADSVAFGFADEVDYVKFTKNKNIDSIYFDDWSFNREESICIEIYDSKSKAWQTYSGEDLMYEYNIDLSGIQNGAECTIKISVNEGDFYAGRLYLISSM